MSPISSALADPLAAYGWRTLVAGSPEDALSVASDCPFDLLVADFRLGAMSGENLAASLRRDRPPFPVLLMSGLHEEARIELWPPAAFMPTILRVGGLVSTIRALFEVPQRPLSPAGTDR